MRHGTHGIIAAHLQLLSLWSLEPLIRGNPLWRLIYLRLMLSHALRHLLPQLKVGGGRLGRAEAQI